jgi:hypothetical protein
MCPLTNNEIEAANRAESTALLIRAGYRVYRPEADCYGEDLIVRTPDEKLLSVQLKGRLSVDKKRYWNRNLWMLFPDSPFSVGVKRRWFLVPHDEFYTWLEGRHGHTAGWKEIWNSGTVGKKDAGFLDGYPSFT